MLAPIAMEANNNKIISTSDSIKPNLFMFKKISKLLRIKTLKQFF